ncbi:hypothetical protein MMU07_17320 [Aquiflexum sp. LQ15W]|uniref:glycosyltransferase family 2 protein n=1 Tax=Cognataquiflexum nitidum TaxID=2922272 RepID=UPI001F138A68|nr:hypothetical protein [Cognataquiflexum nitidum]MCH6201347.1 hypothetical protein [Cognataquiflexum nitidum]
MVKQISASMGLFDNLLFRVESKLRKRKPITTATVQDIPVIINNFNRLDCLQQQVAWLERAGMRHIYIIDNASTYPPLLAYYRQTPYTVFLLNRNVGFMALWKTILFQRFRNDYYIYTDPDIIPIEECPVDAVYFFYTLLQKYSQVEKVGFGLTIDDLSDYYPLKAKVQAWESKFWSEPVEANVYAAPIDTTFALYRPGSMGGSELKALRTGGLYRARHLSWYVNPGQLPEEELYYMQHAGSSSSWTAELLGKERNLKY